MGSASATGAEDCALAVCFLPQAERSAKVAAHTYPALTARTFDLRAGSANG